MTMTTPSTTTLPARAASRLAAIVAVVGLALALLAPAAPAGAQDSGSSGSDNVGVAVNTKDGSSLFKFAFGITQATGEVVDAGNAAVAYASCTECTTVAIAIQFVIVEGSPDVFTPENVAIAMNESCTLCTTMALAYQVVIQTDGPVRLTGDGQSRLRALLRELKALEDQDLTPAELDARVGDLVHQMTEVLSTSLVPIGKPAGDDTAADAAATGGSASTTTTTVRDAATTTSTTQVVRSTTTTSPSGSPTTTSSSTPASTTTTTSAPATTTTTAP
jgi:putative peptide zinc metalloprotease protein